MNRSDNQSDISSEKLSETFKKSWKSLITIFSFFVVIALLVKIGMKDSITESSKVELDSKALQKLSLIHQYATSTKLTDVEIKRIEKTFTRYFANIYLVTTASDSLTTILNQKEASNDTLALKKVRVELFNTKMKGETNLSELYIELNTFLSPQQLFELFQITQLTNIATN